MSSKNDKIFESILTEKIKAQEKTEKYFFEWASGEIDDGGNGYDDFGAIVWFVNDVFAKVDFTFKSPYTRRQWKFLAKINGFIAKVEIQKLKESVNG